MNALQSISGHGVGRAVYGWATAPNGSSIGVLGESNSTQGTGYAVYASGRLKALGRSYLGTPATAPVDGDLNNGSISFHLDQTNNKLKVRVRYSNGTLKTATVGLL